MLPRSRGGRHPDRASMRLPELLGMCTGLRRGLEVRIGAGLGGRVLAEGRPAGVEDSGDRLTASRP